MIEAIILLVKFMSPLLSGIFLGFMKAKSQMKAEDNKYTQALLAGQMKSYQEARQFKEPHIAFTRRVLVLSAHFFILAVLAGIALLGYFNPDITINVPQEVVKHTILSWILPWANPTHVTEYVQLKGLVVVAPFALAVIANYQLMIGFYFGANRR